jgi:hypothetical protein
VFRLAGDSLAALLCGLLAGLTTGALIATIFYYLWIALGASLCPP